MLIDLPREILDHILESTLIDENSRNTTTRYRKLIELCQVNSTFRSVSQAALFRDIRFKSVKNESNFYQSLLCGDLDCVSGLVRSIFWAEIGNKISLVTLLSKLPLVQSLTIYWPSDILQISSISAASHCLRNLHLISTSGINFSSDSILPLFEHLEHLSIINPHPQDLFLLLDSPQSFPSLTSLAVIFSSGISFDGVTYSKSDSTSLCQKIKHLAVGIHGAGGNGSLKEVGPSRLSLLGDITRCCIQLESLLIVSPGGNPLIVDNVLYIPFPEMVVEFSFLASSDSAGLVKGGKQLECILEARLDQIRKMEKLRFHQSWAERVERILGGDSSHLQLLPNLGDTDGYLDFYAKLKRGYAG